MRPNQTRALLAGQGLEPEPLRKSSMIVPAGTMPTVDPQHEARSKGSLTVSDGLARALAELGVEHAFGVFGGGIAPFCQALTRTDIRLMHTRHEGSAAFAAIEASLATGRPSVVVATTGPGLTNLYTGMVAARAEGASVLFVSGCTPAAQRGRGAFQETGGTASALAPLFQTGPLFHHAAILEDALELDSFVARLASGFAKPTGFVAHVGLPLAVQTAERGAVRRRITSLPPPVTDDDSVEQVLEMLAEEPFVIWAGFGARHAAADVCRLAELSGARVMCTPRAKGVMPEKHPLYLGVTGLGGHAEPENYVRMARPARVLVLGSRLGEMASFWSRDLVPDQGLIHVDLDPSAFGAAYPEVPTLAVQGEIGAFVRALVARWPSGGPRSSRPAEIRASSGPIGPRGTGAVRPSFLMQAIQEEVVEKTRATVLTEAGNSFLLGTHHLRFAEARRYRVSTSFGSMGQAAAGVLGAALGGRHKAVAIVGDGAMMMNNEISTAANYGIGAVWIVLNDARYGMVEEGMRSVGWQPFETDFPRVDFVAVARAMGGDGIRVEREEDLAVALEAGMRALGPFVIDVVVDPSELAPSGKRNQSLKAQGLSTAPVSFGGNR
jgi:acetolactate synthase I/II/III large subunit